MTKETIKKNILVTKEEGHRYVKYEPAFNDPEVNFRKIRNKELWDELERKRAEKEGLK